MNEAPESIPTKPSDFPPAPRLQDCEFRHVAILCLTLYDLTPLQLLKAPETLREHLELALRACAEVLTAYDGSRAAPEVLEGRGTGYLVTALFGTQTARENDAERAVRAALALLERVERLNRDPAARPFHLELQIGLHYGEVTTAHDSFSTDAPAIAQARALAMAAPAEHIVLTPDMHHILSDLFHYEGLGSMYLNGSDTPLSVYRVLGANARIEGRWQRSRLLRRSQLVGRGRELDALQTCYSQARNPAHWTWVGEEGARRVLPTLVTISGPEGCGKSRILFEFRRVTSPFKEGALTPLVGRSASIFPVPYSIFSELLRNIFGIRASDPVPVRRRKLDAGMPPLLEQDPLLNQSLWLLRYLIGAEEDRGSSLAAPRNFNADLREGLTRLLTAMAVRHYELHREPLLIYLEDLHGLHDRSHALLFAILEGLCSPVPIVMFVTYRPGFRFPSSARAHAHVVPLPLAPLPSEVQRALIATMLDGTTLPAPLEARLLEKAVGNPYYLEELVRSLVDNGMLTFEQGRWSLSKSVEDVQLPPSLSALLLSRIDQLERDAREVLVHASILGETIHAGVLEEMQRILGGPAALPQLQRLEESGLIRSLESQPSPEDPTFAFENPLVREVALQTLIPHNLQVLHRTAGRAIELRSQDAPADHYLELAHHFRLGNEPEGAAEYLRLAGEKAQREYAHELALSCYTTCLNLSHDGARARSVRWRLARVLRFLGRADEAAAVLEALATELSPPLDGSQILLADVLLERSRVRRNSGYPAEGAELARRALGYFEREESLRGQAEAHVAIGKCLRLMGHLSLAEQHYDQALQQARRGENPYLEGQICSNLGRLALDRKHLSTARQAFSRALELQQRSGDRWGVALELGHLGEVCYASGDLTSATDFFTRCLEQADKLDVRPLMAGARMYLGAVQVQQGDARGLERIREGIRLAAALQDLPRQVRGIQLEIEALERLGQTDEARLERTRLLELTARAGMHPDSGSGD